MDIMGEVQNVRWMRGDVISKVILRGLDQGRIVVQVVEGVQIIVDGVVAKVIDIAHAVAVAVDIRWAVVCWEETKNVAEGHFIVVYLVVEVGLSNQSRVLVGPAVAGYLMA